VLKNEAAIPPLRDPTLLREECFLAGKWYARDPSSFVRVVNPANELPIGEVPRVGTEEVRQCIEAAHEALPAWSAKTGKERSAILRRWYELVLENQEDLATIAHQEDRPGACSRFARWCSNLRVRHRFRPSPCGCLPNGRACRPEFCRASRATRR